MNPILQIGEVKMSAEDIVNYLKFNNEFVEIIERITKDKIAVASAKQRGYELTTEDLQQGADDFRRFLGLHRARDTQEWLDNLGLTSDDFEQYIADLLLKNKIMGEVTSKDAIEKYFSLHSPKFESVDLKQIILDDADKASEVKALLDDDPDLFDELVMEHSMDEDTRYSQGRMMKVRRGTMSPDLEAKVFNAQVKEITGPIQLGEDDFFIIFSVLKFYPAELTQDIEDEVAQTIYDEWLAERAKDFSITAK